MCEITNRNFYDKYGEILKEISTSSFIAIDCEFSGLSRHKINQLSLFDSPSERYTKLRRGNQDFVAFQIGITSFTYNRNEKYEAATYTFPLFPRSYSSPESYFLCDAACIQFLSDQQFDFNKVFRDGVTYMNDSNESNVRSEICDGSLVMRMRRNMSNGDREAMQSFCNQVIDWRTTASIGDTITLNVTEMEPFAVYLVRDEIESRCRNVCTHSPANGQLTVEMTDGGWERDRSDELLALASGFTRLLKEVIALKKPVIGHNMFTDLLVIYKMFIAPLPDNYNEFKRKIRELFPEVYDTKYLSTHMKKIMGKKDLWSSNSLLFLYKYFKREKASSMVPDMPLVEYKSIGETPACENHHDSGFDSFCTGYVFIKMTHMMSMWNETDKTFRSASLGKGPILYFTAVKVARNKINLMRGNLDYISLDGPDPESERPEFILMESLTGAIDLSKVSDAIAKYDNADIKLLSKRQAVIASSNEVSSKQILKHFRRNRNFRLTKYRPDSRTNGVIRRSAIALTLFGGIGLASFLWFKNRQGFWVSSGRGSS